MFILRRLGEKFRAKYKKLFFIFADLEKRREVIHFALRWNGVTEYLVNGVAPLYKGCKTAVSVDGGTINFIFCESWCPSRVCFESTFIHHGNGCSDRRCEEWFIHSSCCMQTILFYVGNH